MGNQDTGAGFVPGLSGECRLAGMVNFSVKEKTEMNELNDLGRHIEDLALLGKTIAEVGASVIRVVEKLRACLPADCLAAAPPAESDDWARVPSYKIEDVRAALQSLVDAGLRKEAKDLVKKFANSGTLKDVPPERYADLMEEVAKLHDW